MRIKAGNPLFNDTHHSLVGHCSQSRGMGEPWKGADCDEVSFRLTRIPPNIHDTNSGIDILFKMRPTPKELECMGPEFAARWETFFKNDPDKPVAAIALLVG